MPPIKVLHGQPSPEELAAVLAVVSARVSVWTDRARTIRRSPRPGAHAWRTSAWAR